MAGIVALKNVLALILQYILPLMAKKPPADVFKVKGFEIKR
jgi:hypothetical protein